MEDVKTIREAALKTLAKMSQNVRLAQFSLLSDPSGVSITLGNEIDGTPGAVIREQPLISAFRELDELFIAPHAETNPKLAVRGNIERELFRDERHRDISTSGGKQSGKVRGGDNRKWAAHAQELRRQILDEGLKLSPPKMGHETHERWKLEKPKAPSPDTLARWIRG